MLFSRLTVGREVRPRWLRKAMCTQIITRPQDANPWDRTRFTRTISGSLHQPRKRHRNRRATLGKAAKPIRLHEKQRKKPVGGIDP